MNYNWTDDRIRWMQNAADFTGYHSAIAAHSASLFGDPLSLTLADGGAGTGDMSIALSAYFKEVSAIDVDSNVLQSLAGKVRKNNIGNIEIVNERADSYLEKHPFDILFFSFYGDLGLFRRIAPMQKGATVLYIMPGDGGVGPNSGSGAGRHAVWHSRLQELQSAAIPSLNIESMSLEFGQPFTDEADAIHYFMTHSAEKKRSEDEAKEMFVSRVTATGNARFPLYLPFEKEINFATFSIVDLT